MIISGKLEAFTLSNSTYGFQSFAAVQTMLLCDAIAVPVPTISCHGVKSLAGCF